MTDTQTEEPVQYSINDFLHYWHDNGAPIFIGNYKDITTHAEDLGFQIYYVVAKEKYFPVDANGKKALQASYRTQTFKVVKNIVGRTVIPTDEVTLDTIEQDVEFNLPKIPWEMMQQLDVFFRKVEDKYHTEAIVLFTYNPTVGGSEGWGLIVPQQSNTSAHCDYDIADDPAILNKPDDVYIVGSMHSHPLMSAYASGTDHKDQAGFDGLHITQGWQKTVNNGATQYHVELQMGGAGIVIPPSMVFNTAPEPEVDIDTIDNWMENVSKKAGGTGSHIVGKGPHTSNNFSSKGWSSSSKTGVTSSGYKTDEELARIRNYPKADGVPDIEKCTIIAPVTKETKECPFCKTKLFDMDIEKRRCMVCHQYLALDGEGPNEIAAKRKGDGIYTRDIDPDEPIKKDIYLWHWYNIDVSPVEQFQLVTKADPAFAPKA